MRSRIRARISIGNSGTGSIRRVAATLLEEKIGAGFNHIPYDGAAGAWRMARR